MNAQPTLIFDPDWANKWYYRTDSRQLGSPPAGLRFADSTRLPMWLFVSSNGARVLSRRPVEVEVFKEGPDNESQDSAFVFACNKLHVYASASTYKDAQDLFHEQVVHFFYVYRALPADQVADDAAEIQALYKAYFEESAPPAC
jgi:hypothetical protein